MRSYQETLDLLNVLTKAVERLHSERRGIARGPLNVVDKARQDQQISKQIQDKERERIDVLQNLLRYPPFHNRHAAQLATFQAQPGCDRAVFIMTKFPNGTNPTKDAELQRVIDAVQRSVINCNFVPHLANQGKHHPGLWDNVELYLLACVRGIAIVENQFNPKLNPNVAMEWGWMRAMGKPVLYLVEQQVQTEEADVSGLINARFPWNDPEKAIETAVHNELNGAAPGYP
jgi:hypothetical protein